MERRSGRGRRRGTYSVGHDPSRGDSESTGTREGSSIIVSECLVTLTLSRLATRPERRASCAAPVTRPPLRLTKSVMSTRASKRGRALSGRPLVSHRDDLDCGSTVMSVLAGAHSVGEGILGFFDTREARVIRLVCTEFREAVAVVPWADMGTRILGNVGGWRAQELPARDEGEHLCR